MERCNGGSWDEPQTLQSDEIDPQMMYDIKLLLSRLVAKASQLIDNFTTNLAEGWMHVRTKFGIMTAHITTSFDFSISVVLHFNTTLFADTITVFL